MPFMSFAQPVIKLSGSVQNSKKELLSFADIAIINMADSLDYKNSVTDEKGFFEIDKLQKGMYVLKIAAFGYTDYEQHIILESDQVLPVVILEEETTLMEDMIIHYKKPVIKRKIDRLEFTIEGSVLAADNAWEILKKTPGVMVSAGESLSVRGSSSILITINDKKVYLTGEELKQLLENTQGENIYSIEVITNPPAKYEAQGGAILNISMKKNIMEGYKASVSGAYVQSMYPKGVVSTSQNYKTKKLTLSGGYSRGTGTYYRQSKDVIRYMDDEKKTTSEWISFLNRKNKSLSQNAYRLSAEYAIDSLQSVTLGTNGFISTNNYGTYNVPTYIYNGNSVLDSLYTTRNDRKDPQKTSAYNLGYEYKLGEKEKLSFLSDYTRYFNKEYQDITSLFSLPDDEPYRKMRFVSDNIQNIRLFSVQGDYMREKNDETWEAGVKWGRVKADNTLDFKDEKAGMLVGNAERTSRFLYKEMIYAGYVSYAKEIDKWSFKAGLRGEYTSLEGNSETIDEINKQNYFKLFPSVYGLYKPTEGHEIGISYSKRISRPQYSWLNPFRSYYNRYSYFTGDPDLKPAIINNISLLYTLAGNYNFDLYYRNESNPAMEISYQDYETNTLVYKFTNIKRKTGYGLDFNTSIDFFSWWQSGIQTSLNYVQDTFQGLDGQFYKNERLQFSSSINNRFNLNAKKDFTAEVNGFYTSPSVQGTFTISSFSSLSVSFRKLLFDGKGEFSVIFSDIYRGEKQTVSTNYANQFNYFNDYSDSQSFRIGFKYNIGNRKIKNVESRNKTEEQQRL